MKQVTVKTCRQCGANWYADPKSVTLIDQDRLEIIAVHVAYCKLCAGEWEKDTPPIPRYDRSPFKKR